MGAPEAYFYIRRRDSADSAQCRFQSATAWAIQFYRGADVAIGCLRPAGHSGTRNAAILRAGGFFAGLAVQHDRAIRAERVSAQLGFYWLRAGRLAGGQAVPGFFWALAL